MRRVGTAAGLGHGQRCDYFAAANRREKRSLLTRIAAARDYCADQRRDQQYVRCVEIASRDFLVRDSKRYVVQLRTAEVRIDHRREQTQLAEFSRQGRRQIIVRVARRVVRKQLAPREVTQRFLQQLLLGGEAKLHRKPQLDGVFASGTVATGGVMFGTVTACGGAPDGPTHSGKLWSPPRWTIGAGLTTVPSLSPVPASSWTCCMTCFFTSSGDVSGCMPWLCEKSRRLWASMWNQIWLACALLP